MSWTTYLDLLSMRLHGDSAGEYYPVCPTSMCSSRSPDRDTSTQQDTSREGWRHLLYPCARFHVRGSAVAGDSDLHQEAHKSHGPAYDTMIMLLHIAHRQCIRSCLTYAATLVTLLFAVQPQLIVHKVLDAVHLLYLRDI